MVRAPGDYLDTRTASQATVRPGVVNRLFSIEGKPYFSG
jgi:hypothetical protein